MQKLAEFRDSIRIARNMARTARLKIEWVRRANWLGAHLPEKEFIAPTFLGELAIEKRAAKTERLGEFPVHEVYASPELHEVRERYGMTRHSNLLRSSRDLGRFYRWLVVNRKPEIVVEFGTAFGVSGMYWLAGLEANGFGELLTFEINEEMRRIAVANLSTVGRRFSSIAGAFEDKVDEALKGRKIDIAFIDAVHTSPWVMPQFEHVMKRIQPGGLVAFDDIDFSDDMRDAWNTVASDPRGTAAVALGGHVGLFEVAGSPRS